MKLSTNFAKSNLTLKYCGEELIDEVLYTVYLKKVRYQTPSEKTSSNEVRPKDEKEELSHLEWETTRVKFIKAGSIEKLVKALICGNTEVEPAYLNVFLTTYRTFSNTAEVLSLLFGFFKDSNEKNDAIINRKKEALVRVLTVWIDFYSNDFYDPPSHCLLQQLLHFCSKYLKGSEIELKVRLRLNEYVNKGSFDLEKLSVESAIALRTSVSCSKGAVGKFVFPNVPVRHFAEQLTRMDVELLRRLIPYQCVGSIWSKRDKKKSQDAASVLATVNQFNAVSFRVISTILVDTSLKSSERSLFLICWIEIAQHLRALRNFSSLKAIISGLQSNPIYRLSKTWQFLPKDKQQIYKDLANVFSDQNNKLLQKECTIDSTASHGSTFMPTASTIVNKTAERNRNRKEAHSEAQKNHVIGTVPYLGTFLTDLVMIDTAIPEHVDSLINFDKKRKEFEILSQIHMFQNSMNSYKILADPLFDEWFHSVLVLDDREAFQLSCQIEPIKSQKTKNTSQNQSKLSESLTSSSNLNTTSMSDIDNTSFSSSNSSFDRSFDKSTYHSTLMHNIRKTAGQDCYIIKIMFQSSNGASSFGGASNNNNINGLLYKSILLSNSERTLQVIRNAMAKMNLQGDPENFTLSQVLANNQELCFPSDANVFYAINTTFDLKFILRPK